MHSREATLASFSKLLDIMDELRAKCPWDKKQTMASLRHLTIEETYELADAILADDKQEVKKELGDLLLHLIFYAKIGSETAAFDLKDVIDAISEKLIYRHPHIYGDVTVSSEEEVKQNWEKLKLKEGNTSVLGGVPNSLPALIKAMRMQEKAAGIGFEWENNKQVWAKVQEEIEEFNEAQEQQDQAAMEAEFGDVLFALINYARMQKINPETALEKTNLKFKKRFQYIEQEASKNEQSLSTMDLEEMLRLWNKAKTAL